MNLVELTTGSVQVWSWRANSEVEWRRALRGEGDFVCLDPTLRCISHVMGDQKAFWGCSTVFSAPLAGCFYTGDTGGAL